MIRPILVRQRGVALPVMLIMMLVMLVTSVYLLKSSNSTTLSASNLAYDASLTRAADLGLHTGFQWLSETAVSNRSLLNTAQKDAGYNAVMVPQYTARDAGFWTNSRFIADTSDPNGRRIEYVIHRLCRAELPYDDKKNACVQTAANTARLGTSIGIGESLASDAPAFAGTPQVHYVITARIVGVRGGNVVNQLVVLIGA